MQTDKPTSALRAAFPHTLPTMAGYLFLGIAFGVLLDTRGYGVGWALLMSIFIFAGSMQIVATSLLAAGFNPLWAALMTFMVNARHLFYSISMLEPYKGFHKLKPYMIFSLTDETFALLCTLKPPDGVDAGMFRFWISLLHQSYWIIGSVAGSVLGAAIPFNSTGIEFVMTALFVVILIEQWRSSRHHTPALLGLAVPLACLLVFGAEWFILPSMAVLTVLLTALRAPLERGLKG